MHQKSHLLGSVDTKVVGAEIDQDDAWTVIKAYVNQNLTYATELFVDIALSKKELDRNEFEVDIKTG